MSNLNGSNDNEFDEILKILQSMFDDVKYKKRTQLKIKIH